MGKTARSRLQQTLTSYAELRDQKLDKFYFEHCHAFATHLVRMTVGGVLNDMDLRRRMLDQLM